MPECTEHEHEHEHDNTGSGTSVGLMGRLNVFSRFVRILKDGGPHAIIAILIMSNVWTARELRDANDRIINLLITLQLSSRPMTESAPASPYTASAEMDLPMGLPAEVRSKVLQTQEIYHNQVQQQLPVAPYPRGRWKNP